MSGACCNLLNLASQAALCDDLPMEKKHPGAIGLALVAGAIAGAGITQALNSGKAEAPKAEPTARPAAARIAPARPVVPTNEVNRVAEAAATEALRRRIAELEQADTLWREQNAELQRALAAREARPAATGGEGRNRRPDRPAVENPPREPQDPAQAEERQRQRDEFRANVMQRAQDRTDFLKAVDTSKMSDEQRQVHDQLLAAVEKSRQLFDQMSQSRERSPELFQQMREAMTAVSTLYGQERRYLLEETGRAVGYKNGEEAEFASHIESIFQNTSMEMNFGRGRRGPPGGAEGAARAD